MLVVNIVTASNKKKLEKKLVEKLLKELGFTFRMSEEQFKNSESDGWDAVRRLQKKFPSCVRDNQIYCRDLSSSNGTMINQQKVYQELKIESGDILRIGRLSFIIQIVEGIYE